MAKRTKWCGYYTSERGQHNDVCTSATHKALDRLSRTLRREGFEGVLRLVDENERVRAIVRPAGAGGSRWQYL